MDKKNFFVKDNDIVILDIFDQKFKYKKVNSDDELSWLDDYTIKVEEKNSAGEIMFIEKQDKKMLAKCKLRNIVEIPFTKEEIKLICNIDKEYKDFTDKEKDLLFGKLNPVVLTEIILKIDGSKRNKKKD